MEPQSFQLILCSSFGFSGRIRGRYQEWKGVRAWGKVV